MATKGMKGIKDVAPLAGAWIEIFPVLVLAQLSCRVAPLAGAWIEIIPNFDRRIWNDGRSPRGSVD